MAVTTRKSEKSADPDHNENIVADDVVRSTQQQHRRQRALEDSLWVPLSTLETLFYLAFEIGLLGFASYKLLLFNQVKENRNFLIQTADLGDIKRGTKWPEKLFGIRMPLKDCSDVEWTYMRAFVPQFAVFYLFYCVVSQLLWKLNFQHLREWVSPLIGLSICFYFAGWGILLCEVVSLVCMYLLAMVFKSQLVIWAFGIFQMGCLTNEQLSSYTLDILADTSDQDPFNFFVYCVSTNVMRQISFGLEMCKAPQHLKFQLHHIFNYCFYPPLCPIGPILPYNEFVDHFYQERKPWNRDKVTLVFRTLFRAIAHAVFIDFFSHFIFLHVIIRDEVVLSKHLDKWSLGSSVMWAGVFFQMEYTFVWGVTRAFARADDVDPPEGPACVMRITKFSLMWKHFDNGLYRFIRNYIYIPLGGSRNGLLRQTFASFSCFLFIYYWHGGAFFLFVWVVLNLFVVSVEAIGQAMWKLESVRKFEAMIGARNFRRLVAAVNTPLYMMSVAAIQIFFVHDAKLGWVYIDRYIFKASFVELIPTFAIFYSAVQNSFSSDNYLTAKEIRKIKVD